MSIYDTKKDKTYILFLLVSLHVQITQSKFCQSTGNGSSHKEFSIQQILTQGRPVGQNKRQFCIQIKSWHEQSTGREIN